MQKSELITAVEPILAQLDDRPRDAKFLAKGATCSVWQVVSSNRVYALRIIDQPERVLDGNLDAFIRGAVRGNGGRVSASLLNSEGTGQAINGQRWCLDEFAKGTHPLRGELSNRICRQLGRTLAAVHQIPTRKYGQPFSIDNGAIIGRKSQPFEGVALRFENPLPETWSDDYLHPVFSAIPELKDAVLARLQDVSERVQRGRSVLCHSDLHEGQLICVNDTLTALIDFGDATIMDRYWDLGSALYFHGKENFSTIFEAYSEISLAGQNCARLAASFSIAIAMHHASRSRLPGKGHRMDRAIRWLRQAI